MLSIHNVTSGQASTYYTKDTYYTRDQLGGRWVGRGAELLDLDGDFTREDFENIIHGRDRSGAELIERGFQGKHQSGKDLTFSAPKSVSVLSEVLGDENVREAHDRAVSRALCYLEEHFSEARITVKGVTEKVKTGNLAAALFQHDTSRELDPQLHSHAVVMNMTMRSDGKWRALASDKRKGDVLYGSKMFIGQVYRNELAGNLKDRGYDVISDSKGLFEIRGMDKRVLDEFSSRKEQIDDKVRALKESGLYGGVNEQKLREIAALGSRVAKKDVDMDMVRSSWQERLYALGHSKESLMTALDKADKHSLRESPFDSLRMTVYALTEHEAVFTRREVIENSLRLSVGHCRVDDFEKAFDELTQHRKSRVKETYHPLDIVTLDKKEGLYTTREMQKIEKEIVEKVRQGHDSVKPFKDSHEVERFLSEQYDFMTEGQRHAVKQILSSPDRYVAIQGDVGTGKTTSLEAVTHLSKDEGYTIRGLAYTGKAGAEMMHKAGIDSQTLHSFLSNSVRKDDISPGKEIWIVDEASMVGNRQMGRLIEEAEKSDAKVILMGDTKQLTPLEAGRIFSKLQETGAIHTVEMKEVLRQKDGVYRDIVADVSEKKIERAFDTLEKSKKLYEIPDKEELKRKLVLNYISEDTYKDCLVVTTFNKDRKELNTSIRQCLQLQGRLPKEEYTYTTRESKSYSGIGRHFSESYRKGDIVTINKTGAGIKVGQEGTIVQVNSDKNSICLVTSKGDVREINVKEHGEKISVFSEKETPLSHGDKVVFLKNNKRLKVQNGLTGHIKSINSKGDMIIVIDGGSKREVEFTLKDYNYLDHGYAVTDYKSQGQTAHKVFYHAPGHKEYGLENVNSYNSFYVCLTRGRSDIRVYSDDMMTLKDQVKQVKLKSSTLDYGQGNCLLLKKDTMIMKNNRLTLKPVISIAKSFVLGKEDRSRERER